MVRQAVERKRDCEGAYYLLCRALFAAGRYQEVASIADAALDASGEDYNIYVPIVNRWARRAKRRRSATCSSAESWLWRRI